MNASLPNPFTPMAFIPPNLAYQITIGTYVFIGGAGILAWDILDNLHADFKLLVEHRIRFPTIVYLISRITAFGFVITSTALQTAPLGDCRKIGDAVRIFYATAIPATSLLFFLRLQALFHDRKAVTFAFFLLWVAVIISSVIASASVTVVNIGPTKYCTWGKLNPLLSTAAIMPLFYDTLIFLAISLRLMTASHVSHNVRSGLKTFLFGRYLPTFSKALLQDGQMYYLTTIFTNLMALVMLYITSVPVLYRIMFTIPNLALMNIMACRVFRNLKLGSVADIVHCNGTVCSCEETELGGVTEVVDPITFRRFTIDDFRPSYHQSATLTSLERSKLDF